MNLFRLVFPEQNRGFWGKRWLNVYLRSAHLCGACGYSAGILFDVTSKHVLTFYLITAISGLLMIVIDVFTNGIWIIQNRGWMIILKTVLAGHLLLIAPYEKWGLFAIIIFSSIVSHATGNFRYYSVFHRKRVDLL